MKKTFQLGSLLIGALALSFTLSMAEGKCGDAPKAMKSHEGKCAAGKKDAKMKCTSGKCGNATKEAPAKPAPAKGKCGQGKCG